MHTSMIKTIAAVVLTGLITSGATVQAGRNVSIDSPTDEGVYARGATISISGAWSDSSFLTDPSFVKIVVTDGNDQIRLEDYATPNDTGGTWVTGDYGDWDYGTWTIPSVGKAGEWGVSATLQDAVHTDLVTTSIDIVVTNI